MIETGLIERTLYQADIDLAASQTREQLPGRAQNERDRNRSGVGRKPVENVREQARVSIGFAGDHQFDPLGGGTSSQLFGRGHRIENDAGLPVQDLTRRSERDRAGRALRERHAEVPFQAAQ